MARRNDLSIYERHAASWWDPTSPAFRSLHTAKRYHRELVGQRWDAVLDGAHLVDLGCGGGLLSIPLLPRLRRLTAVDLSAGSLDAARAAAGDLAPRAEFLCGDLCATGLPAQCADLATLSDVVEHLAEPAAALREAARILRPGGQLFVNTFNRTRRATWLGVHLAEGIGLIPRGTHDPTMFLSPSTLATLAADAGLRHEATLGEAPRLWRTLRHWAIHLRPSRGTAVSYSAFFVKAGGA